MPDADPPPQEAAAGARMSPQQRRLWLLGEAYGPAVRRLAVELTGELDAAFLRTAVQGLLARHDILRTGFRVLPGLRLPLQVADDAATVDWTEVDLRGMPAERQEERIAALLAGSAGRWTAADLAAGPAMRATLAGLSGWADLVGQGDGRRLLVLELPALRADGLSLRSLVAELAAEYGERGGRGGPPDEPMQYWQYSEWLNEILAEASPEVEEGQAYWKARADLAAWTSREAFPELPGERARPEGAPFRAAELAFAMAPAVASPAFLAAAWLALLWRLTGEGNLVVGATVDGREFDELRTATGPFARVLPLRASVAAGAPFSRLVEEVREALADSALWQRYFVWEPPRAEIRDPRRPPFFPFAFEHRQVAAPVESGGVTFAIREERGDAEPFKVKLIAVERGGRGGEWELRLRYDADRYAEPEIRRLGSYLQTLLASAVARPETALQELDLLPAAERARLLELAAGEAVPAGPARLAHQLFAEQAARTPGADALVFGEERTSYAELDARTERIARRLRELGVGPERVVGLALEPSPAAVVGLLAILKAGGAFLPLDPHGPAERRAFMLRDSGAAVLVTRGGLAEGFRDFAGERVLVDAEGLLDGGEAGPGDAPSPGGEAGPENLAYVLYTSGSTGTPKGVGVEHRSLASYLAFIDRVLFGDAVRICPWLSALTFDASWKQVLAPLTRGGAVWGLGGGGELDPAALLASLAGRRGVALNGTPSLWKAVLDEVERAGAAPSLAGVSRLLLGGERLSRELFARSAAALPAAEIWNLYGPTETTANSAVARLAAGGLVTIGRPIAGTRIQLLDAGLQPVPAGVAGELYVAGAGVARGYLGRPDLTAARFLPDPFAALPGGRLYRTGDLGRLTPAGEIEYLGRTDHQVKVRGFRIELEEIEARLALHPAVREAAVLAETAPGDGSATRLVAYVVPDGRQGLSADALRAALREMLPEYMVPAAFVSLPRLPLLPGGKVDRGALQRSGSALVSERPFVAPRTATERRLAEIWAEVLGRESVGVEDDFFELGGHSIQSIQITHRARSAGFALSPRDLLQQPTIAALAALADAASPPASSPSPPPAADAAAPPADADWEEGSL